MSQLALANEIIDEIGRQTLLRFKINIFNLDTYNAYGESVKGTNIVYHEAKRYQKNPQQHGHNMENMDVALRNIKNVKHKTGKYTATTDTLSAAKDMQTTNLESLNNKLLEKQNKLQNTLLSQNQGKTSAEHTQNTIKKLQKSIDNINKQINDYKHARHNFDKEATMHSKLDASLSQTHHNATDVVELNENTGAVRKEQHKNLKPGKNSLKPMLEERYLDQDNITIPKGNKQEYIEALKDISKSDNKNGEVARKILEKESECAKNGGEFIKEAEVTRQESYEAKKVMLKTQVKEAAEHIALTAASDAGVMCLSIIASSALAEIRDIFNQDSSHISSKDRIVRFFNNIISQINKVLDGFFRSGGFATIDIIIQSLMHIVSDFVKNIKYLWTKFREKAKIIFDSIYSYIKGEIKTFSTVLQTITIALFGVAMLSVEALIEKQLKIFFAPLLKIGEKIAIALAIVLTGICSVLGAKAIQSAFNTILSLIAQKSKEKLKRQEIEKLVDEVLPDLIQDNAKVSNLIDTHFKNLKLSLDSSFDELTLAVNSGDSQGFVQALVGINQAYGTKLAYANFDDFDTAMKSDEAIKF